MLKNRIIYLLIGLVILGFLFLYEHSAAYRILYVYLVLPAFSFLGGLLLKGKLSLSFGFYPSQISKSEDTLCYVQIQNDSFLPCGFVRLRLPKKGYDVLNLEGRVMVLEVAGRSSSLAHLRVHPSYSGIYTLPFKDVSYFDFLGLFKFKIKEKKDAMLVVTPEVLPVKEDLRFDGRMNLDGGDKEIAKSGGDVSGVRDYVAGDVLRDIHWKASSKRQKTMVKLYEGEGEMTPLVLARSRSEDLEVQDQMRSMVASVLEKVDDSQRFAHAGEKPVSVQSAEDGLVKIAGLRLDVELEMHEPREFVGST